MEIKRDILWRVYLSFLGIVVVSLVVLGRAFYIQKVQGTHWRGVSDSLHQRIVELDAERGTIYSEDGQMLSTSVPYFDVYMDMEADGLREKGGKRFRENIDSFSLALANFFKDKTKSEYKKSCSLLTSRAIATSSFAKDLRSNNTKSSGLFHWSSKGATKAASLPK